MSGEDVITIDLTYNELVALFEAGCDALETDPGYDDDHPYQSAMKKIDIALQEIEQE